MSQCFPQPYERPDGNIKVELDLNVTKVDLKGAIGVDKSNLAPRSDLANLQA